MTHYLAFFKPYGVLSQFTDHAGRQTLKDYIHYPGIYSAGRLDFRSEGLLVLSDDGAFIHRLTDPRFEHPKTYLAQVEGIPTQEAIRLLQEQILLPGVQSRTADVELISTPDLPPRPVPVRDYHPTAWLKIILCEGKKHQVRRMTAAVGLPTLRLVRVAIGKVTLGSLKPGEWRRLSKRELASI
jgi:23S rRNA pseudouridine2457 synthase